jgi:NhaA family Na+:H+ antiporter
MADHHADPGLPQLPNEPIDRFTRPLARFMHVEAAGGVVLMAATIVALVLANSAAADAFLAIWKTRFAFSFGGFSMDHSIQHWINDGLMAVFFFVIGLEVKRELVIGELRELRRATLPLAAAIGGMVVPAGIYFALQGSGEASAGWGIPMATDIAFVVGCLALLGPRVPGSLRVLLLSLAIADDIGAILVIALGYTAGLDLAALALGFAGIGGVVVLARLGVRSILVYTLFGAGIWLAFHESGVHATIAGVILGLLTPAHSWVPHGRLAEISESIGQIFRGDEGNISAARHVERTARESVSPLIRLETLLHPWVGFFIMPLFALVNAGVPFNAAYTSSPVALAVIAGLVIGKPVGILGVSYLAVRTGLARLPEDFGWGVVAAAGSLAGIGFTMSLFIAGLALDGSLLDEAKVGVLAGSVISGVLGYVGLMKLLPTRAS